MYVVVVLNGVYVVVVVCGCGGDVCCGGSGSGKCGVCGSGGGGGGGDVCGCGDVCGGGECGVCGGGGGGGGGKGGVSFSGNGYHIMMMIMMNKEIRWFFVDESGRGRVESKIDGESGEDIDSLEKQFLLFCLIEKNTAWMYIVIIYTL